MKAAKIIPVDRDRENVLRAEIGEVVGRHRAAMEAEIAPQMKELADIVSTRPIMVTTDSGYTYIYRPATPAGERRR